MQMNNRTPLCAEVWVNGEQGVPTRRGEVVAKATFRFGEEGGAVLDADDPVPLFEEDQSTPLGLMPRDDLPAADGVFEVIVLGAAHAPGGRPTRTMRVALSVGETRREVMVFGDRKWLGERGEGGVGAPAPFDQMPLSHRRAMGGSVQVLVDRDSRMVVSHPLNPEGRGFDPAPQATQLGIFLACPAGYPAWAPGRALPNLERPGELTRGWEDDPEPVFWSAVPLLCGLHMRRILPAAGGQDIAAMMRDPGAWMSDPRLWGRAHPDWAIPTPEPGALVTLEGMTPGGRVTFPLPRLRVVADLQAGGETSTVELRPTTLVLLPEEARFTLVFRAAVEVPVPDGDQRAVRLRVDGAPVGGVS